MKSYEQWQCPRCEDIEPIDVEDIKKLGHPVCVNCNVKMERLMDILANHKTTFDPL